MRFHLQRMLGLCAALLVAGSLEAAQRPPEGIPAELRRLAAQATKPRGWPALRRYAEKRNDSEVKGWAYFVLGEQEYDANDFSAAAGDLRQAAATRFSLADYATYYGASASRQANDAHSAAETLDGFATRFPESAMQVQALELLAQSWLDAHEPQRALQLLQADSRTRLRPSLAILLGQAYSDSGQVADAARTYQELYCAFPASSQAKTAADALASLRTRLGADFPQPSDEILTARADALLRAGDFDDALKQYDELISAHATEPQEWRWQLGKARCLARLKRTPEAREILSHSLEGNPTADAQRLALLVEVFARDEDEPSLSQMLSLLQSLYTQAPEIAPALNVAGNYYYRKSDWTNAARLYQSLLTSFPESSYVREADWRLAVCTYFLGDHAKARQAFRDHITHFPDSPHVAAALFWAGRLAEEAGEAAEARAIYRLVQKRFVHSYYAQETAQRVKNLSAGAADDDSGSATSGPVVATLAQAIPPVEMPSSLKCGPATSSKPLRLAEVLSALDLDDLAGQYARAVLAAHPDSVELQLFLSRVEAEQDHTASSVYIAIKVVPTYSQAEFSALPKELWDLLFPRSYWKLVSRQARANRLDPYLVMGLIRQESAFNPKALSSANARGLMQILPETASRSSRASAIRAAGRRLYDPAYNVRFGCAYLRGLLKQFDGKPELALAAYHAGDFRVRDWITRTSFKDPTEFMEAIPIPATRAYVEAVMRNAEFYRRLMTSAPKFGKCS